MSLRTHFEIPSRTPGIYAIVNTETGRAYVGSSTSMRRRWYIHRRSLNKGNHHCRWLQRSWNKYGSESFTFMVISRGVPLDDLHFIETEMISKFSLRGGVYNSAPTAHGTLNYRHTPEAKEKIRASLTGRGLSEEHRKRIGDANRKRKWSEASKSKLSASATGRTMTAEAIAKRTETVKSTPPSPRRLASWEAQRGRPGVNKGKTFSDDVRANMSKAKKGRPWSAARRAAEDAKRAVR